MINEYHFDKLIIGGSLECLLYCFINNYNLVIDRKLYPLEIDKVLYNKSLRLLGYDAEEEIYKSEMWDRLSFILSLSGHIIIPNTLANLRRVDGHLVVVTKGNKRIKLHSENIVEFDNINNKSIKMVDWFDVRSGNNHNHNIIKDPNDTFINEVHFYTSKRLGRNRNMKDIFAISNLTREEATNVNYGEGIARLKVISMMKEAGIKGQSNGFNKAGKRQHFAIKIEHVHRQFRNIYQPLCCLKELLTQEPKKEQQWNIMKKLFRHKQISTLQESFRLPANL
jgi:hypothetical protein